MKYLSTLLNKPVYINDDRYGTIVDFGVPEKLQTTSIGTVLIKKDGKKFALSMRDISLQNDHFVLATAHPTVLPYDENDFYLAEDLLDKQVIDVTGRRLVRVNDVLLKENGTLNILGIDIGFSGVLRRLGLDKVVALKTITIPWSQIEAFDYQTGDVRIKLHQSGLNNFHPAEIADILEDAGSKERMGVVEVLDAEKAAAAIEEANEETQESILDELPQNQLKSIIQKMPVSEIADILHRLSNDTVKSIYHLIGQEKTQKVKKLLIYPENVAGGMMTVSVYKMKKEDTIADTMAMLAKRKENPEGIIIVDDTDGVQGMVETKYFINADPKTPLGDIMQKAQIVNEQEHFEEILTLFAEYNLRILPVVDEHDKLSGVIAIDAVLAQIQQEEEIDETI